MEEIYLENFLLKAKTMHEDHRRTSLPSIREHENLHQHDHELFFQMSIILSQLDRWIIEHYQYDEGINLLLAKIKRKVTERQLEEVISLLTRLEELLDICLLANGKIKM